MKKYILIAGVNGAGKSILPVCDLAAFYDNTIEFRRFAIYKNGELMRISHDVPGWFEKFVESGKSERSKNK